jgi:hypothetical protein
MNFVRNFLQISRSIHGYKMKQLRNKYPHVASILHDRNSILQQTRGFAAVDELQSAYAAPTSPHVRRKGIYVWVHADPSKKKVYVGSYHSTCLWARTTGHLVAANSLSFKAGLPKWRRRGDAKPYQLYHHMLCCGVRDLLVFPLELLPDTATNREVLQAEQRWINRFNSKIPDGYNSRNAHVGMVEGRTHAMGRYYAVRDMCRRTYACYRAHNAGRLTDATHTVFFHRYHSKTLQKLLCFCRMGWQQNGVSATSDLAGWQVPVGFAAKLQGWVHNMLESRYPTTASGANAGAKRVLVTKYWDLVYQHLNIAQAMRCDAAMTALPWHVQNKPLPTVAYKYRQPLGRVFCNHATVARSLTPDVVAAILAAPCPCEGHLQHYYTTHGLISQPCGHVVSCSSDALGPDCPFDLRLLFGHGPKHRPLGLTFRMTATVRQQIYRDLAEAFTTFATKYPDYARWSFAVIRELRNALFHTERFADGKSFTCSDTPCAQGTVFTPWLRSYETYISRLHEDFVITTADKLNNNYVVVCKKHYVQQLLEDLSSGLFYVERLPVAESSAVAGIVDSLQQAVMASAPCMYHGSSEERLRQLLHTIPYEAALVKLHKTPVALRFLACSGANGLKIPAVWLTKMFRAVQPDLCVAWSELLRTFGVSWAHQPPWYATQSSQVTSTVQLFNSQPPSWAEYYAGGGWQGYDVIRLYTNIDIADLNTKLSAVLGAVWRRHAEQLVLHVFKDKFQRAVWWHSLAAAHARYPLLVGPAANTHYRKNDRLGCDGYKGEFYLFDLQHACQVMRLLTENSYVQFGGRFFKQTRGIPMGINPAVYMANFYLFYYEQWFLQRLQALYVRACAGAGHAPSSSPADWDSPGIAALLAEPQDLPQPSGEHAVQDWALWSEAILFLVHQFKCTVRFVDDLTAGNNHYLDKLLYYRDSVMGGHVLGIYPGCPLTNSPQQENFWFWSIHLQGVLGASVPWM